MKQLVSQYSDYTLYKVGAEYLYKIAEFIVLENYGHHTGNLSSHNLANEIDYVYKEELEYSKTSQIYVLENRLKKIVGCIRVMLWDRLCELPIQKIFNINPLNYIISTEDATFWHIGRFAVSSCLNLSSITLFKKLMFFAIEPICKRSNSYMIAECDSKLLRVMGLLGIKTTKLSNGIHYLGSETIPVYSSKDDLSSFYNSYKHLLNNAKVMTQRYNAPWNYTKV